MNKQQPQPQQPSGAIARLWRGLTPASKAEDYLEYLKRTGVRAVRQTPGNRGVYVLRRLMDDRAEFLFVSLWDSLAAIQAFAGSDIGKAVYYPEDAAYLLELDPGVTHHDVLVAPDQ
jgi:heme-degrading monooxygenase HmoA